MIRFGIIGTNWITESFITAAREVAGFQLTAVYSRSAQRAEEFAAKVGASYMYTDVADMARSGTVDAVYIASPNSFHAEQAILCMQHGLHVLCEKPIASNAKELQEMISAAKQNGVVLMEALKSTLLPNFTVIQENLHRIGKIRRYVASYCQYSSRYDAYKQGTVLNAFNPIFSNGSLMDLGIYCLYPMIVLFGKPDQIQATGIMLESGVDGEGSILFKYADMDAIVMYSKISNSMLHSEIQGESGTIIIDRIDQLNKVEIRYKDGTTEMISQPQKSESMSYEVEEFIDLIQSNKGESTINSHANSMKAMEAMDEARKQMGLVYPADRE